MPSSTENKNETTKFLGDGVSFKAKLIGILEVSEARGDRMCQEALSDLKMAIRAAGEHKQRITINIAIDGLRLRDEKTGDSLYHHPVHKISFIAQDMTDSRAFGYIFGSPDIGHRFFGIKTDKAASQVVIAMRDLFQVVFALKKKEIEIAKQNRYLSPPLFSDSIAGSKGTTPDKSITNETKTNSGAEGNKASGGAVADLVDLELELNSLQQGLNQMERITPSDPYGSKEDPFGDSFINYNKPILPPPPSSGKERNRPSSETSSIFSPKTPSVTASLEATSADALLSGKSKKGFSFSHDFDTSHDEPISGDWMTIGTNIFEEQPSIKLEPTKDEKHEQTKKEIMSQFDIFTELDPLGTGKSKPYIDKKDFFQELKNPPKKALNDLVFQNQPSEPIPQPGFTANFPPPPPPPPATTTKTSSSADFATDPFGEDPFVTEDPFADSDFSKQDPFESEFSNDFKEFTAKLNNKIEPNLQKLYQSTNLSKSPNTQKFTKPIFNAQFEKLEIKKEERLLHLHENPSLDISSESECAPEPPPRPTTTLMQIKPPPLPPKKQAMELSVKPPPRPPHSEISPYDYMDNYETAPTSLDLSKSKSPPLPVPSRKAKFESDFIPERPRKQFNIQSSDEDYLTPISLPQKGLLPPPQKANKRQNQNSTQVTVASFLESKPNLTTSKAADNLNTTLEGLNITLSQLTLSGLNELANKLNIPPNQLSNMTLVQLTNYLSNFIQSKANMAQTLPSTTTTTITTSTTTTINENINSVNDFKADFEANFSKDNAFDGSFDRYAVFRELIKEEIKETKPEQAPEAEEGDEEEEDEDVEEEEEEEEIGRKKEKEVNLDDINNIKNEADRIVDKYAALREIVEGELKLTEEKKVDKDNINENEISKENNIINEQNIVNIKETNIENKFDEKDEKFDLIEYSNNNQNKTPKSPRSPNKLYQTHTNKSPVPIAVTEIKQNNARLNSGSLSDVIVSGSSPDIDNTPSNSEVCKKDEDATGETWAIFDQANLPDDKEKLTGQSEEGVSPWSSDSKEFGNGSPEWRRGGGDSGSGREHWMKRKNRRDQDDWWDTSAEPEVHYYPSNRRSTDSYEDEYYECYERPRRRKTYGHSGQITGGHSSSSRDVSPWEEEPRRKERGWPSRHSSRHSFDKRRHNDSWDDEDEYEEDHGRFHRYNRDERKHSGSSRDHDEKWSDEWNEEGRHRRRRKEMDRERWCCPDWEKSEHEKSGRYGGMRRDRKHEECYYSRESQDSPWEDDYGQNTEEMVASHYLTAKRNWKRPSSASEVDRKTGEIKNRHYLGPGGSDGERDRRYKPNRRSRSRDSQYSEPGHRHKPEPMPIIIRTAPHRIKPHSKSPQFENNFTDIPQKKLEPKLDYSNKKNFTLLTRKKIKEEIALNTFPRKTKDKPSLFDKDFDKSEQVERGNFNFDDLETSEAESPTTVTKPKNNRRQLSFDDFPLSRDNFKQMVSKVSPRIQPQKCKSMFEDDFSPREKPEQLPEDNSISSIKEELDPNDEDTFNVTNNLEQQPPPPPPTTTTTTNSRKVRQKNRLSDINLKKSESVNIFARESDPFDDDFFSENFKRNDELKNDDGFTKSTDLKWSDDFDDENK